jgi:hypothetical protein
MTSDQRFEYFRDLVKDLPPVPSTLEEPKTKSYNFIAFHLRGQAEGHSTGR